ncbi:HNH endonuclease [Planomicrobium okeanokoites]|uniref:HNH endonuclease n=1 Tax=Planomicrobium okeanokoites TaxID=244 RepID=UPI0024926EE7|nr:HNH endonuclease [Planomicrobium okeanokoites]
MEWIIPANSKIYDYEKAFSTYDQIDWKQSANYQVGDTIYVYATMPVKKILYKTKVVEVDLGPGDSYQNPEDWIDKDGLDKFNEVKRFVRLEIDDHVDNEALSLDALLRNGLNGAPQGPLKVNEILSSYIEKHMSGQVFPDEVKDELEEGQRFTVKVNRYERNPIARKKCIEIHGDSCAVCSMNFVEVYGEVGEGFIHVHHIKPLHEIGEQYLVDYEKDLVPVCPNCHAMLHRKIEGRHLSIEELKRKMNMEENVK